MKKIRPAVLVSFAVSFAVIFGLSCFPGSLLLAAGGAVPRSPGAMAADPNGRRIGGIDNVFIVVIDGLRDSEAFDDPDHQYIPRIWNDLRPLGTIYTNFLNTGHTATTSGHSTMTSGVTQFMPNTLLNGYGEIHRIQEEPSIFQYYRSQLGVPQDKTWIINGKGPMMGNVGICQNPLYGGDYSPMVAFVNHQVDDNTWAEVQTVIDTYHPSLTLINFKDVDETGHTGNWNLYTAAIRHVDSIIYDLCQKIWNDPVYDDNTLIIITSDHGRHLNGIATGFQDHGCACLGCRRVAFLAIGPGIRQNAEISDAQGRLCDIAPTVAAVLGFEARFSRGRVLREIFENPPPEEAPAKTMPAVACSGDRVHLVFSKRSGSGAEIVYANTRDGGQTWHDTKVLSTAAKNLYPSITADGNRVAVAWSAYETDGKVRVAVRESTNKGGAWGKTIYLDGKDPWREDLHADVCYSSFLFRTYLYVVWREQKISFSAVNIAKIRKNRIYDEETIVSTLVDHPSCAASWGGVDVVYQDLTPEEGNWDVFYCRYDGAEWGDPVPLCDTPGESLEPDIAVDSSGKLHAVWAENDGGLFEIVVRNSDTGSSWDKAKILSSPGTGAWHPAIAASGKRVAVVWEGVDGGVFSIFGAESTNGGKNWSSPFRLTVAGEDDVAPAQAIDDRDVMHVFSARGPWPTSLQYTAYGL